MLGLLPTAPAAAAGPAVVSVNVTITDPATGLPMTSVNSETKWLYLVNVAYSCNVADCTGVTVTIPGVAVDPYYGTHRREALGYVYNPPFTPAPAISGNVNAGFTVNLGTVTAGSSGTFSIQYNTGGQPYGNPAPGSFFPNGSLIQPQATITASNSDNPATSTASATWVNTVPVPNLTLGAPASTRTDTSIGLAFSRSGSGCATYAFTHDTYRGKPWLTCAASYVAVVQLPPNAQYVPGSGGTYDPVARTVTFTNSGTTAAHGIWNGGLFRVTFPNGNYPTAGAGCVASETFTASQTVTYLEGTVKTATSTRVVEVQNCAPFAKATMPAKTMQTGGGPGVDVPVTTLSIPNPPAAPTEGRYWKVTVSNQANVPGVATITDNTLDQPDLPVTTVAVMSGGPATINYTLDDGTTGTTTGNSYPAPAGRRITAVTATSSPLPGPNAAPTGTAQTPFTVAFRISGIASNATPGERTNTASGSVTYPGNPELGTTTVGPTSRTITLVPTAVTPPQIRVSGLSATPLASTPVVGSTITWTFNGALANAPDATTILPQYVFVAPEGWDIEPNGASVPTGPAGIQFDYKTVTYLGKTRNAVVATWPAALVTSGLGVTLTVPAISVKTKPTIAAPAGTANQIGVGFFGDANHMTPVSYSPATPYTDVTDFDEDSVTTDAFAVAQGAVSLAPTRSIGVSKEICQPNPSAGDGCTWIANSNVLVGVPPSATAIKYRVTIRNTGNAALTNVVGYDVLPFIGDTGTTTATAGTPRGSTVKEVVGGVSNVSSGIVLAYSTSTNPPRPQVYTGTTSGTWTTTVAGASSIRATIANLPAFESRSFTYDASLVGGAADQIACNSVAVNADTLVAIEPAAVCATTQEADFSIVAGSRFPLQEGRVGTIPFVVNNGGGSLNASGTVTLSVPAGLTIANLAISGWSCSSPSVTGPVDVTCTPVNPNGTSRQLAMNVAETIPLRVTPAAGTAGTERCSAALVVGLIYDPDPDNNDTIVCSTVAGPVTTGLTLTKDDAQTLVAPGQQYSYTIVVSNELVAESVAAAVLTDSLPNNLSLVSTTPPGTVTGQNPDGTGGTITWNLAALSPVGVANANGDGLTGGAAPAQTLTVTVVASANATGTVTNTAAVSAPNPGAGAPLGASATDVNDVQNAAINLTKTANPTVVTMIGQLVTYNFTVANPGNVPLTGVTITDPMPGLSPIACVAGPQPLTLAPSTAVTCIATRQATAADFVAGQIVNTATATGQPPLGSPVSKTATATVNAPQTPGLQLTKHATPTSFNSHGTPLTFTFDVVNTGNVAVTGLVVNDQLPGTAPVVCAATALAPGAATTCSTTYTTTRADVDAGGVTNTATATATAPGGPTTSNPSTVAVEAPAAASIRLAKSAAETTFNTAGDVLHYSFVVTNNGNVTLTDVSVTDGLPGLSAISCPVASPISLPAGGSMTCTATYATTQADLNAGFVLNSATASGVPPSGVGDMVTWEAGAFAQALQQPAISIVKTVDATRLDADGQILTYTFLVSNTGNVTLTGVAVNDALPGLSEPSCPVTTLAPGTSMTCTATYTLTQADIDTSNQLINTATATGAPPTGPSVTSLPSSAPVPPALLPSLSVVKTATEANFDAVGDTLNFEFDVTNTGNMTLFDLAINDPLPGVTAPSCPVTPLAPGASATCTATYATTQADIDNAGVTNSATASAKTAGGQPVTSTPSPITVPALQTGTATFVKNSVQPSFDAAGQVLDFTFTVTNTGNTTLSAVRVTDTLPGVSVVACPAAILAPTTSTVCTATYTTAQGDVDAGFVTNDAQLDAKSPLGQLQPLTSSVTVNADRSPAISVLKTAQEANFDAAGDAIHYWFQVTNTGNVTLSGVNVVDPLPGLSAITCPDTVLDPNESTVCTATYAATQGDVDLGSVGNTAVAAGNDPDEQRVTSEPSSLTIPAARTIDATIGKSSTGTTYDRAGQVIGFTFVVTNTGNVTLNAIAVTDDLAGVPAVTCTDLTLAPSASTECAVTYSVTQQDVDTGQIVNTAHLDATPANAPAIQRASNAVTLTAIQDPALTLLKEAAQETFDADGQTLNYTFTVTNTGNVTVEDLTIDDELDGIVLGACDVTTLAPTEVATCDATYVTTQADVDDGFVSNTATASATAVDSGEATVTSNESTAEVDALQAASATFTKGSNDSTYTAAGQAVTFTFVVDNTGNVTLDEIGIVDHLAGVSAVGCPSTTLGPDQAPMTCTGTYTVTQADLDNGLIFNTATLTAVAPPEQSIELGSGLLLTGTQTAAIAIVKSVAEASFDSAADTLHYTFHVTNTGNVRLSDVTVTDPLPGLSAISCPGTELVPGESMDCTATYATTQADVDAGGVSNTATATGVPPSKEIEGPVALALVVASAESSAFVPALQNPGVTLTKNADVASYAAGQTITYRFVVTNTGNVTITGLTVNDPLPGLSAVTCPGATLAPGASTTCTATYVATQSDVTAGVINNTATVSAAGVASVPLVSQPSTVQVAAVVTPPPPPPTTVPSAPADPGQLPATGGSTQRPLLYATVLVLAGLIALAYTRRRRTT
jgi:uncharacterized repeat protein (TIGR01451 family)/LPXTG-motif cell wall-anchored protein